MWLLSKKEDFFYEEDRSFTAFYVNAPGSCSLQRSARNN